VASAAVTDHRQGWDLQLTQYGDGNWRATFYVTGQAHSIVAPEELGRGETRRQHYEAVRTFQLVIRVAASSLNHLRA
jgi:hypothetical protein